MPQRHEAPTLARIDMMERGLPAPGNAGIIIPDNNSTWLRRQIGNASAIASRNIISVVIPTALREFIRRVVFSRIAEGGTSLAFGATAGYLPCVLQVGGLYNDIQSHTYTRWTIAGRMACIILPGAGVTALIAVGGMGSSAAAALGAANFIYTPLRDIAQNYFRRDSNLTPDEHERRICAAIGAVAYVPNQMAVNEGMQYGADFLTPYLGSVGANVVARAGVNFFGECLDDTVSLASTSCLTGQQVRTHTRFSPPSEHTWGQVADRILNIHASRSALFSSTFSAAFLADLPARGKSSPGMTSTIMPGTTTGCESPTLPKSSYDHEGLLKESAVVGLTAGVGYFPFIVSGEQTAPRRQMDLEAGRGTVPGNDIRMTRFSVVNE
ncbi:hypothetical protein A4308_12220 [Enterobacter sp. ODB01]|nr:hypothetical protein A4308_12220 [Enterobacter sp. ODB01]VAL43581.1 Uncharacterised protein [Enterobacter kobei]